MAGPVPPHARKVAASDHPLPTLAAHLERCKRRASRLWKNHQAINEQLDPAASAGTHRAWSDQVDEALEIAEAMSRQQANDLAELASQYEAIWWWLIEDDSVLEGSAEGWRWGLLLGCELGLDIALLG
jgi:hypothetical protein